MKKPINPLDKGFMGFFLSKDYKKDILAILADGVELSLW